MELAVDRMDMGPYRLDGNVQLAADFSQSQVPGEQAQDPPLEVGELVLGVHNVVWGRIRYTGCEMGRLPAVTVHGP
jgi:hypothetical protein